MNKAEAHSNTPHPGYWTTVDLLSATDSIYGGPRPSGLPSYLLLYAGNWTHLKSTGGPEKWEEYGWECRYAIVTIEELKTD